MKKTKTKHKPNNKVSNEMNASKNIEEKISDSSEVCFNILKYEYDHGYERALKLDNKVSIILAFTGIMFGVCIGLLKLDAANIFPISKRMFLYNTLSIFDVLFYCAAILIFLYILTPHKLKRFSAEAVFKNQLQNERNDVAYNYAAVKYANIIGNNDDILEKLYKWYSCGIDLEIIANTLLVLIIIYKFFFI